MQQSTKKSGGVVVYSNQKGCDGDRFYYGGKAAVIVNGTVVAQGPQFTLNDVEVTTATIYLSQVRCYRQDLGLSNAKTSGGLTYKRVKVDFTLSKSSKGADGNGCSFTRELLQTRSTEEEFVLGPACWLWDMLRRSGAAGFLCPLSGGIDSCSTATLVYGMCRAIIVAIDNGISR